MKLVEKLDAVDIRIDPIYRTYDCPGLDTKNLYLRPGRFIPVVDCPADLLFPFKRDGHTVYMTPRSAHDSGLIGCARYQWLRLIGFLKGLRWTPFAN